MSEINLIGNTDIDSFVSMLGRIGVIDIGTISGYLPSTGRATVSLFQILSNKPVKLKNVEVMFPGSAQNGFIGDILNAPCLVIYPRSVVPSLKNGEVLWKQQAYSSEGVKCIPLSVRPDPTKVRIGFDGSGRFVIACDNYTVTISNDGISYTNKDNTLQYDVGGSDNSEQVTGGGLIVTTTGKDGSYELYYKTTDGLVAYRVKYTPDGKYVVQRGAHKKWEGNELKDHDSFTDYAWTTIYSMDGTIDISQQDSDGNSLNHITVDVDGNVVIEQEQSGSKIEMDQQGNIKITAGGALETITGSTWKGGSEDITLKTMLIDDLLSLLDSFDTVGSPGNHSTGPRAKATIVQLKQKWGQLLV